MKNLEKYEDMRNLENGEKVLSFAEMSVYRYAFYVVRHPFTGYSEMKYNKKFSIKLANLMLFLWFFSEIIKKGYCSFDFVGDWGAQGDRVNILNVLITTIVAFALLCITNWALCTLFNGKGKFSEIWNACAYALIPIMIFNFVWTLMSYIMVGTEGMYLDYAQVIVQVWTVVLILAALMGMHDYTMKGTVFSALFTVVGLVIIIFLIMMVYVIATQMIAFVSEIAHEIQYKFLT